MKNFDQYIAIDWSGAKSPVYTKAIQVAAYNRIRNEAYIILSEHHKFWSRTDVSDFLCKLANGKKRILVGIDCNFGYASHIVKKHVPDVENIHDFWKCIDDCASNDANYFAGSFWHHEIYGQDFWCRDKQPDWFEINNLRRMTEKICGEKGYGWPESPFKLIGAKQVGKGGLAGMRMALDLKRRCGDCIAFWPFESEICNTAKVIVTEIYPRQFLRRAGFGNRKVKDKDELNEILAFFDTAPYKGAPNNDHETDALIAAAGLGYICGSRPAIAANHLFDPPQMCERARTFEGWILGCNV